MAQSPFPETAIGTERKRLLGHERTVGHTQSAGLVSQGPEENTNVPRERKIKSMQKTMTHVVGLDPMIDHAHDGHMDDEHHDHLDREAEARAHARAVKKRHEHHDDLLEEARKHHAMETGEAGGHSDLLAKAREELGVPNPNHVEAAEAERLKTHEPVPGLK